ncbi:MAG: hypothetical protein K9W44_03050 [Candidatus Lokiarchaeota archaeon]|nr:hypothetical protein [Candidatus Harpocratesius repetitus]
MGKEKKRLYGNKYVNVEDGKLKIGNFSCLDLAKKWETPIFLFLEEKIQENINYISSIFSEIFPQSQGFYSVKSNYLQKTAEIVKEEQFGAEIVSLTELQMLKRIGFDHTKIIVGGPYLPDKFLMQIVQMQIPYIVIYDLIDISRISQTITKILGANSNYCPKILLKFQTKKYTSRHGLHNNKETYKLISEIFKKNTNVEYAGVLSHFGTRLKTWLQYEENMKNLIEIVQKIKKISGLSSKILDIGGGFSNADSLKEKEFRTYLVGCKNMLYQAGFQNSIIFYEPGRFIVEDTGFCIAEVIRVDPIHKVVFLNIGNNYIPKFMKSSLRFYNATRITEAPNSPFDFMGNIPSDQDILIKNYNFTKSVSRGDIIVIANVGAYALTWSTRFPYSFPNILFLSKKQIIEYKTRSNSLIFPNS